MSNAKIEKSYIENGDMEKINRYSRKELTPDEVYVFTAALCDNDIDRDGEKFSLSALYELKELFTGKTGICDHSMKSSDQKARIFDTYVEKQEGRTTADGEDLYCLKARAYMLRNESSRSLIEEIDAGIKKEVSVSCSMKTCRCSVCQTDKRVQRCEHIVGNTYGGKRCYSVLEDALDAYEFSFVAVPAQRNAGVTKSFNNTEVKNMEDIVNTIKSCDKEGMQLSKSQADHLASYIEALEEEAKIGADYKKELSKEIVSRFALQFPEIDSKLFSGIVSVMTAKELLAFKNGLEKSRKSVIPQIMPIKTDKENSNYSQFRI